MHSAESRRKAEIEHAQVRERKMQEQDRLAKSIASVLMTGQKLCTLASAEERSAPKLAFRSLVATVMAVARTKCAFLLAFTLISTRPSRMPERERAMKRLNVLLAAANKKLYYSSSPMNGNK